MAGATSGTEKEPVNIVHRNAIFRETIRKEQRDQKLYTSYGVNPYTKSERAESRACAFSLSLLPLLHSARHCWKTELAARFRRRHRRR